MSRMLNKGTPGFEHVPRFWDAARAATIVKVLPGQYYVSSGGELLATVLGSCVSACIRDTRAGVGGVNHFMLPDADGAQAGFAADAPHRYGSFAMEAMLNELYKRGASRRNLEVKVVGGGAVMRSSAAVGERNIRFVREFLENEGMPIAAQDVGDACARRVLYDVTTGKMLVKRLQGAVELDVTAEEEKLSEDGFHQRAFRGHRAILMTASQPVRTLIVDDSALVRKLLTHLLDSHPRISVVGTAIDAQDARAKIKQLNPDVLTLDIEMPGMDGLNFLGKIMTLRPMPVIMVSTLTSKGADASLEAMRLGAFDVFPKPRTNLSRELDSYRGELQEKVLAAAHANVRVLADRAKRHLGQTQTTRVLEDAPIAANSALQPLVAIGASTGGTEAIALCMERLPANMPGIVITQHIPGAFSESFARRLNDCSALNVTEARHGDRILAGHAYVAPGDQHLEVVRDGAHFVCRLNQGEPVNRHRPSVDVMFDSVARCARNLVVGVLLTGMGKDGAQGLLDIRQAGGRTIAQDEESSVVWGMPGSAVKLGAAESIMPIDHVAPQILTCLRSLA